MAGTSRYSSYNCLNSWDSYDKIPRYIFTSSTFFYDPNNTTKKVWWFSLIIFSLVCSSTKKIRKLSMYLKRLN